MTTKLSGTKNETNEVDDDIISKFDKNFLAEYDEAPACAHTCQVWLWNFELEEYDFRELDHSLAITNQINEKIIGEFFESLHKVVAYNFTAFYKTKLSLLLSSILIGVIAASTCGLLFSIEKTIIALVVSAGCLFIVIILVILNVNHDRKIKRRYEKMQKLCDEFNKKYLAKNSPDCKLSISKYQSYIMLEDRHLIQPGMNIISMIKNKQQVNNQTMTRPYSDSVNNTQNYNISDIMNPSPGYKNSHDIVPSLDFRDHSLTQPFLSKDVLLDFDQMSVSSLNKVQQSNNERTHKTISSNVPVYEINQKDSTTINILIGD